MPQLTPPKPGLFVKANPSRTADNPGHYHVYRRADDGTVSRQQIVGFSYFGEVGGLKVIPADNYVVLDMYNGSADWTQAISASSSSTAIRMSYEQWFDLLADHGINFSRIFVYPDVEQAYYPCDKPNGVKYDLASPGSSYLNLLQRYILYAQRRNIIVQISFAGVQTLRGGEWGFHPMNANNNVNLFLNTADGRKKFCVIAPPSGAVNTEPEKNYEAQFRILEWIVAASSWAWNVVYELFNEPGGTDAITGELDWLVAVATWLDLRLRVNPAIPNSGHTHLITLNSGPTLLTQDTTQVQNNVLKRMLFDASGIRRTHPLIDVFSFHGTQWGNERGKADRPPGGNQALAAQLIENGTRSALSTFYSNKLETGKVVEGSPVALICDSDAQYRAQDNPKVYAGVVLNTLQLDYNHRWSSYWLSQANLCHQVEGIQNRAA